MLDGKRREDWIHTAHIVLSIVNQKATKESELVKWNQVYPFAPKRKDPPKEAWEDLKMDVIRMQRVTEKTEVIVTEARQIKG